VCASLHYAAIPWISWRFGCRAALRNCALALHLAMMPLALAQGQFGPPTRLTSMSASGADAQEMLLQLGEQRVLPSENVRSYSEANKGVVDIRLTKDASQFIIVALRPGSTTLLFLMMDGSERHFRITVIDPNAADRSGRVKESVEATENIRLDFYFVQVSKRYRHQIGVGWPGSIAPTLNASINLGTGTLEAASAVVTNQALPRLDMAQVSGWAKIMRQAAVVTVNGQKATFAAGGEFNVTVQGALTTGLQKIPFGSVVEVDPRYDAKSGRIEVHLRADISELDSDNGTGVPGRITSTLDTEVNLQLGESIILAGLTARSERRSKSGMPLLSQIPILGVLFGSHAQVEDESENIILIVPSVVDVISMQDRERVASALRTYAEFSGSMDAMEHLPPPRFGAPKRQAAPLDKGTKRD